MESCQKLKSGGIYIIEDVMTRDADALDSFVAGIAGLSKAVVCEALEHPLNTVDNRLVIIQEK